jgi:Uma2 family endonuclease
MSEAAVSYMSEEEFVAFELASPDRHEFVDGVTRAMTGASIRHNDIALNLALLLRSAATGTNCKVNIEGVRLNVNSRRHYYPDVMVTCEESSDTHAHSSACLIAEVLSPTTTAVDRGEKRIAYMAMPSLRHLLLIDLEAGNIEHQWRINSEDPWFFELGTPGTELHLTCPTVTAISVDDILADS